MPVTDLTLGIGNLVEEVPSDPIQQAADLTTTMTTSSSSRPRRQKAKYGTGLEEGYYDKLNKGKLPGQSFYSAHLAIEEPKKPEIGMSLSSMKAEHDIARHQQREIPKNYR